MSESNQQSVQEAVAEIRELFRETDSRLARKWEETDSRLARMREETDSRLARMSQETDAGLRRLEGLFGVQWGRMMEALVEPAALRLFQERGIQVSYIYQRSKSRLNGTTMEIDLLLEDGDQIVVLEVKSTLRVEFVQDLLDDLDAFPRYFPKYAGYHIYGALACLNVEEDADRYAYRRGLFVLRLSGDGLVEIKNDSAFRPRDFGVAAG